MYYVVNGLVYQELLLCWGAHVKASLNHNVALFPGSTPKPTAVTFPVLVPCLDKVATYKVLKLHTYMMYIGVYTNNCFHTEVAWPSWKAHHSKSMAFCSRIWAHVAQLKRTTPGKPNTGSRFRISQSLVWGSGRMRMGTQSTSITMIVSLQGGYMNLIKGNITRGRQGQFGVLVLTLRSSVTV